MRIKDGAQGLQGTVRGGGRRWRWVRRGRLELDEAEGQDALATLPNGVWSCHPAVGRRNPCGRMGGLRGGTTEVGWAVLGLGQKCWCVRGVGWSNAYAGGGTSWGSAAGARRRPGLHLALGHDVGALLHQALERSRLVERRSVVNRRALLPAGSGGLWADCREAWQRPRVRGEWLEGVSVRVRVWLCCCGARCGHAEMLNSVACYTRMRRVARAAVGVGGWAMRCVSRAGRHNGGAPHGP